MSNKLIKINKFIIILLLISLLCFALFSIDNVAYATSQLEDGKYNITFDTDLSSMGMAAFENGAKKAVLEKIGNMYYLTVSFDTSSVSRVTMNNSKGKVGETIALDGKIERHTYTLNENSIKNLSFSVYVNAMSSVMSFNISPNLSNPSKIGDADKSILRPAEFMPVLTTKAISQEMEKGSSYKIPDAVAKLGDEDLVVDITAYYILNDEKTNIDITSGVLKLDKVGEYHIVFTAESNKYKDSKGNNTKTVLDITLTSKIGAASLVRIENVDGSQIDSIQVLGGYILEGSTFDAVKNKMEKIADNFQIVSVELFNDAGETVTLDKDVSIYIRANDAYDRKEIKVYYLSEDGSLQHVPCVNYGRYIKLNTDKQGDFVIYVPGVEFHMPMWGYALIVVFSVIILIVIIVVTVVIIKKKKTNKGGENGNKFKRKA